MINPIVFAFISYFGWAIGDIWGTVATRKLGGFSATFWAYVGRLIIFAFLIPLSLSQLAGYTPGLLILNFILGTSLLIGFLAFNHALKIGNPAIVGTIASSFVAVVVLLSIVFLHQSVTPFQLAVIILIICGVALTCLDIKAIRTSSKPLGAGAALAIVPMVTWGIYFAFIKIPVQHVGWFWPNYISFTLVVILYGIIKFSHVKLVNPWSVNVVWPTALAILLTGVAEFSFNYAVAHGNTAIVAPIAGSNPTLFVVLAYLVFREPLGKQQVLGIVVAIAGIVGLALSGVS